jgi:hypothetical protein
VVVVGLFIEYKEDAKEFFTGRPRTRRNHTPVLVGGLLVVLGIVGELTITFFAHRVEIHIRSKSHEIEGLLNKEAGDANERAKVALSEQERLKGNNLALEKEVLELKKAASPRTLSDSDRKSIAEQLKPFAASFASRKISVSSYSSDAEGIVFSLEILDILSRAGINTDPVIGRVMPVGLVDLGVKITGPIADGPFIKALLTNIHSRLDTKLHGEWDSKYTDVRVAVGVKPVPGLPDVRQPPTVGPK